MTDLELGFRDAIHVPYIVVRCNVMLQPGDKVSLRCSDTARVGTDRCAKWAGRDAEPMWHAVADPFLEAPIPAGESFRAMLRPECFTRLRHDFQIEVHDRGGTNTCHAVCDVF